MGESSVHDQLDDLPSDKQYKKQNWAGWLVTN